MKRIMATALAGAMAIGVFASAEAEAKKKRLAEGIIIGIGIATLFGAAAAAADQNRGRVRYSYRNDIDPRDNAVAACLHRAHRVVRREGGEGTELRRVRNVSRVGSASWRVEMQVYAYFDGEPDRYNVTCRVFRDRVTRFGLS
jgi:hypothetical protein